MFDEARGSIIRFFETADFDLRSRGALNPVLQTDLDAQVWGTVTLEHCKRLMQQIQEVMEEDGFPGV